MAEITGGDLVEITCNHPTLGDFTFSTKSNESYTMDPGGFRSNDDANGVTGSGKMINQLNRVRWSFEGPLVADLVTAEEVLNIPALAGNPDLSTWTFTHISGAIYRGTGTVVGDIQFDTNTSMLTIKISGGGTLEQL